MKRALKAYIVLYLAVCVCEVIEQEWWGTAITVRVGGGRQTTRPGVKGCSGPSLAAGSPWKGQGRCVREVHIIETAVQAHPLKARTE